MKTSYETVESILGAKGGQPLLDGWSSPPAVQQDLKGLTHEVLYSIDLQTLDEMRASAKGGKGTLKHPRKPNIPEIANCRPTYPMGALLYSLIEQLGRIPTFPEYWAFVYGPARSLCYDQFLAAAATVKGKNQAEIDASIEWCFGLIYTSAFREIYTAVWLHAHGLPVHYHTVADIELQSDLFDDERIICLRVRNEEYLDRKRHPSAWARRFHIIEVDIPHQGYGTFWVPTEAQLQTILTLKPVPGATTTLYANGEVLTTSPSWVMPLDVGETGDLPELDAVLSDLKVASRPKYSITLVGQTVGVPMARRLLESGLRVVQIGAATVKGELLEPFEKAGFYETHALPEGEAPSPLVIIDGKANDSALQLLDALGRQILSFNSEQWRIEHADADALIQVRAGAGTGKTAVTMKRVDFLLHTVAELKLSEICLITFTNEATNVMRERLRQRFEAHYRLTGLKRYREWLEELAFMKVSTIPSFAKGILTAAGSLLGYGTNFRIRSFKRERERIMEGVLNRYLAPRLAAYGARKLLRIPLFRLLDVANRYWEEMGNKGLTEAQIQTMDWGAPADPESAELNGIWSTLFRDAEAELQALKTATNTISLSDLTREIQRLSAQLAGVPKSALGLKYLFVDEFQDSDDMQIHLVSALQQVLGCRLFVVGDVKQSIYRFRGATHTAFDRLAKRVMAPLTTFSLTKNYRTSANLLEKLDPLFQRWGREGWLPYEASDRLVGVTQEEGELRLEPAPYKWNDPALKAQVLDWIEEAKQTAGLNAKGEPCTVAILVRTNRQAATIKAWCDEAGIFCSVDQGGLLFASPAAHHLRALVSALLYPEDPTALWNLLGTPYSENHLPWAELLPHRGDPDSLVRLLTPLLPASWKSFQERKRLEPVLSLLRQAISEFRPVQRYHQMERAALTAAYKGKDPAELEAELTARTIQYQLNLDRILELMHASFAEQFVTLYGVQEWLRLNQATNREESEPELPAAASAGRVRCITVHGAKGAEYHTVIVPFTDRRFRLRNTELLLEEKSALWQAGWLLQVSDEESYMNNLHPLLEKGEKGESYQEETRLLYVALTRVERRLWVLRYVPQQPYETENWGRLLRPGR